MSQDMSKGAVDNPRLNWCDPLSYKPLLNLDRAGWAWKWLRRNPDYIAQMIGRPVSAETIKTDLPLLTMPETNDVSDWGLLFRREAGPPGDRRQTLLARRLGCLDRYP
jgi:hypothetical protein